MWSRSATSTSKRRSVSYPSTLPSIRTHPPSHPSMHTSTHRSHTHPHTHPPLHPLIPPSLHPPPIQRSIIRHPSSIQTSTHPTIPPLLLLLFRPPPVFLFLLGERPAVYLPVACDPDPSLRSARRNPRHQFHRAACQRAQNTHQLPDHHLFAGVPRLVPRQRGGGTGGCSEMESISEWRTCGAMPSGDLGGAYFDGLSYSMLCGLRGLFWFLCGLFVGVGRGRLDG